jgi:hypothetical protein
MPRWNSSPRTWGRHLDGPSDHGPTDTVRYRVTKFVQRHKALVTASGAIAVCPIGGIIVSLREAHRADAERALAVRRVHDVRELARSNVFDMVDSLRQLPGSALAHRRQNSLLQLGRIHPGERWEFCVVFVGGVQTFRDHTPEFTGLAALQAGNAPLGVRRVGSQAQADTRNGEYVSGNFFRTFGVQPWIGRLLTEGDDQEGAPLGAVMS